MVALTQSEKVQIRNAIERKANNADIPIRWVKNAVNDVAQAVEDILASVAFRTSLSDAIDAAAAPYGVTFTNAEKKWIVALIMQVNYTRDIV